MSVSRIGVNNEEHRAAPAPAVITVKRLVKLNNVEYMDQAHGSGGGLADPGEPGLESDPFFGGGAYRALQLHQQQQEQQRQERQLANGGGGGGGWGEDSSQLLQRMARLESLMVQIAKHHGIKDLAAPEPAPRIALNPSAQADPLGFFQSF